jgi:hypothetical protein
MQNHKQLVEVEQLHKYILQIQSDRSSNKIEESLANSIISLLQNRLYTLSIKTGVLQLEDYLFKINNRLIELENKIKP